MKKIVIIISSILIIIAVLLLLGEKHISTDIVIQAPAEKVWDVLIDFKKYPEWNPFIRKASGDLKEGNTIEVTFQTKGSDPIVFTPTIIAYKEKTMLQWEGRLLMPGIFTGRHTFLILTIDRNKTHLIQKEDFNGILIPFFNFDSTIAGFISMNNELKKRVESK